MNRAFDYSRIGNPFYVVMIIVLLPLVLPLVLMAAIVAPFCTRKQKEVQTPFKQRP